MAPKQRAPHEVQRILTRLILEYRMAGWSHWTLGRECGVHSSVLQRWENGKVQNPLLSLVVAVADFLGLRMDFVAERHLPLLPLDEFEIAALIEAADAYRRGEPMRTGEGALEGALGKLGRIDREANEHV